MSPNLKIIFLKKRELADAVNNNTYWINNEVAMPKSKALWLLKNERIESEDYVAVIGLENNEVIAYTLIIPDVIQLKNKTTKKINWIHIWWVNKKYKGHVLGTYLFNETINILNKNVLLNSYIESTNDFFKKGPFRIIERRKRFTIFFNLDNDILINKFHFFKYFKWVITICNFTLVKFINFINNKKATKRTADLNYDYLNELDEETWEVIKKRSKNDFTLKTKEYVNWLIDNTQYTQTPFQNKFIHTYSTTGFGSNIHITTIKIIYKNNLIGMVSYVLNSIEFNIKFFLPKEEIFFDLCTDVLMEHFFKSKAKYIITDDLILSNLINKRYIQIFTYQIEKKAIAHKNLDFDFQDIALSDRDGRFY